MADRTEPSRFRVTVNGVDISPALAPVLNRLTVRDATGAHSDTAEIELDDSGGRIVLPKAGAKMRIELQDPQGMGLVFTGVVDEVGSAAGRGQGRILTLSAKGADVLGRLKQAQERHFDETTVGEALRQAGEAAGLSQVSVDPALGGISRPYIAMQGESFLAFGQRLAREVGGTFKVSGDRALLVRRNGGSSASGKALPAIVAAWGENLQDWDIKPSSSRPRHRRTRSRFYDRRGARWREKTVELEDATTEAELSGRYAEADEAAAGDQAVAAAAETKRAAGQGSVTILGDVTARPEAVCRVVGARPGVDGDYRITAVEHALDRSGGLVTRLELGQPHGAAGTDGRTARAVAASTMEEG